MRVAIIGLGGTGSVAAEYLARSGVELTLIDRDIVEKGNLNRQLFYRKDIGKSKSMVLAKRLRQFCIIEDYFDDFNLSHEDIVKKSDLVLDGSDNMETRFLINDFCMKYGKPFTYAASAKNKGIFAFFVPKKTACLRCLIPSANEQLEGCEGIVGPVAGMIGILSATTALEYLKSGLYPKKILYYDKKFNEIAFKKRKGCPTCRGVYPFDYKKVEKLCSGSFKFSINGMSKKPVSLKIDSVHVSVLPTGIIIQGVSSEREAKNIVSKAIRLLKS